MLERVDRIQLTTHDAAACARRWTELLDAQTVDEDHVAALGARRVTVQIGDSFAEILEPTGPGLARAHLDTGRGGPFAVGVTARDTDTLLAHLGSQGIEGIALGGQWFFAADTLGIPGLDLLLSPEQARPRTGLIDTLYEVTHLTDNPASGAAIARVLGLDAARFVPIESTSYGYRGHLTLFDTSRLHRIETIVPYDADKTMGRFFRRFGPSLYMCYAEVDDLGPLRERLKTTTPGDWTGSDADDDGLFVHPKALEGVMMGVSRTTHAWTWSGYPERRVAP